MKKGVKIILIILITILVIVLIFAGTYFYLKNKCINDFDVASLTAFKCMSLCPSETTLSNYSGGNNRIMPKLDCMDYCLSNIQSFSDSGTHKYCSILPISAGENIELISIKILAACMNQSNVPDFNYGACLGKEADKYSNVADLSGYQLGDYPKFDVFIENLTCKNGSVDVTIRYLGDYANTKTIFTIYGSGRSSRQEKESIANGETKTYSLSYNSQDFKDGMSSVAVSLVLLQNGKEHFMDNLDEKSCQ